MTGLSIISLNFTLPADRNLFRPQLAPLLYACMCAVAAVTLPAARHSATQRGGAGHHHHCLNCSSQKGNIYDSLSNVLFPYWMENKYK